MTPEITQWIIYAALLIGGYLLRHWGIAPPGGKTPTPPVLPQLPGPNATPALEPLIEGIIGRRLARLEEALASSAAGSAAPINADLVALLHKLVDAKPATQAVGAVK